MHLYCLCIKMIFFANCVSIIVWDNIIAKVMMYLSMLSWELSRLFRCNCSAIEANLLRKVLQNDSQWNSPRRNLSLSGERRWMVCSFHLMMETNARCHEWAVYRTLSHGFTVYQLMYLNISQIVLIAFFPFYLHFTNKLRRKLVWEIIKLYHAMMLEMGQYDNSLPYNIIVSNISRHGSHAKKKTTVFHIEAWDQENTVLLFAI